MQRIILIDFDGTICEHTYPDIGKPIPGAIETLLKLQEKGHKLILWTVRGGKELQDAVDFCDFKGIKFWGVNENPDQNLDPEDWGDEKDKYDNLPDKLEWSCKPYGHLVIDDINLGCPVEYKNGKKMVNWKRVYLLLKGMGYL